MLVRGRTIHFAPEASVSKAVRPLADSYLTADLIGSKADLELNLENLDLEGESVDTFIASHVLEHVDDYRALAELHRCLVPGGSAILMVPIVEAWSQTYENPKVRTKYDRTLHFGLYDHLRYYGRDVRNRILSVGFELEEFTASGEDCARYGLYPGETVFVAVKPNP